MTTKIQRPPPKTLRCAIYTRKSTEEGLGQEFNSLDAQRESGEAYIKSLQQEGWHCLPEHYDDGGFTGGNMDRPALKRLRSDIEAGKVDVVVVYKVDRLSRSLPDFARLLQLFEEHNVAFVSVTQQFNTSTSMGRLVLNMLFSFAQFEREIISERTRDKIAATRRKGKRCGGMPVLGYDVLVPGAQLTVDEFEAARVQAIFEMYDEYHSLLATVQELEKRGWCNKQWTTRNGNTRGGLPFTKTSLYKFLTNVIYRGMVNYKGEIHPGEHSAIVSDELWQRVQTALARNGRSGGVEVRNKFGALLKGLLHCVACDCAMSPSHTTKGNLRFRYYLCVVAQKRGWDSCPAKSIPASEIERHVVDQIKRIGRNADLVRETIAQARSQAEIQISKLEIEERSVEHDLGHWYGELRSLIPQLVPGANDTTISSRLADLHERVRRAEQRAAEVAELMNALRRGIIADHDVIHALSEFDSLWATLTPQEQIRIVQLLIERVDYDGRTGKLLITFHPAGIKSLANNLAAKSEEVA